MKIKPPEHGNIPVLVSASERADIALQKAEHNSQDFYEPLAAVAAGHFISEVRGLPLCEAEVEIGGNIYSLNIDLEKGMISEKLKKCKQLLSKTLVKIENIDTLISDYMYESRRIRLIRCDDAKLFSDSRLKLLFLRKQLPICSVSAVYSCKDGKVEFKYLGNEGAKVRDALGAALAIATEERDRFLGKTVLYSTGIGEALIAFSGSGITLFSKINRPKGRL